MGVLQPQEMRQRLESNLKNDRGVPVVFGPLEVSQVSFVVMLNLFQHLSPNLPYPYSMPLGFIDQYSVFFKEARDYYR